MLNYEALERALERAGIKYFETADTYGEPGYTDPEVCILLANWNDCTDSRLLNALEKRYSLEWEDEWVVIYEPGCKAYRTSPDSYGWIRSWVEIDGELYGLDEIVADHDGLGAEYIEHLTDNPEVCALPPFDLEPYGFKQVNGTFENGWYPGQNDYPADILARYQEEFPTQVFAFGNVSVGQFDVRWELFGREKARAES